MGINCRVVDGDYFSYEDFVKLYNDYSIKTEEIKKIVGGSRYLRFHKEAMANNDIQKRPVDLRFDGKKVKHYHYDKQRKKFRVRKVINGKYVCFGYYETEEEAQKMVEELKKVNWDKSKLREHF